MPKTRPSGGIADDRALPSPDGEIIQLVVVAPAAQADAAMSVRAPVEWRHADGAPMTDAGRPMAPYVAIDALDSESLPIRTLALIDTGAAISMVTPGLLAKLRLRAEGKTALFGNMGVSESTIYDLTFRLAGYKLTFNGPCAGMPQGLGFPEAQMLVGMNFLRLGRLVLDVHGDSYWELPTPTRPAP